MTNIEIVKNFDGIEQIVIDNGDGSFTSMSKATYEAQQAEQSTQPIGGNI